VEEGERVIQGTQKQFLFLLGWIKFVLHLLDVQLLKEVPGFEGSHASFVLRG
jgi:hypothetical protein